jgi:hypothetical protein
VTTPTSGAHSATSEASAHSQMWRFFYPTEGEDAIYPFE